MGIYTVSQFQGEFFRFKLKLNCHLGHRRTASLPSGPLPNTGGSIGPSVPLTLNPLPVFPSLSQFTRVLDETRSASDVHSCDTSQSSIILNLPTILIINIIFTLLLKQMKSRRNLLKMAYVY